MEVMDLFEQSKLKNQKLKMATLLHKPEFKQNYLSSIRALSVDEQCNLLQSVARSEITLTQLQSDASRLKQKSALKKVFILLTNVESWEEAAEKFPAFATHEQLDRFRDVDIRKTIPKTFTDFCQRAKNSSDTLSSSTGSAMIVIKGASAIVVVSPLVNVTGSLLRSSDPAFQGANIVITSPQDNIENVAYTIKKRLMPSSRAIATWLQPFHLSRNTTSFSQHGNELLVEPKFCSCQTWPHQKVSVIILITVSTIRPC